MTLLILSLVATLPSPLGISPGAPLTPASLTLDPTAEFVTLAQELRSQRDFTEAIRALENINTPSAALVRARIYRDLSRPAPAAEQLTRASADPALAPLLHRERAYLAILNGNVPQALIHFQEVLSSLYPKRSDVGRELARLLREKSPTAFLSYFETIHDLTKDTHHQSLLLKLQAEVFTEQQKTHLAHAAIRRQLVEEPVAHATPRTPPPDLHLSTADRLKWAEGLLNNHSNTRAIDALMTIPLQGLQQEELCHYYYIAGKAHRKLRRYSKAEDRLLKATAYCEDPELRRKAYFIAAKVISIQDGLRSIETIEGFVKAFPSHSMVDDVLFWAGDTFQRRDRNEEAITYYRRAENRFPKGDMCGEARWRRAWMAYRAGDFRLAKAVFEQLLSADGCVQKKEELARASYWLARIAATEKKGQLAIAHYQRAIKHKPLGFYAQMALKRLESLDPAAYTASHTPIRFPFNSAETFPGICPGNLTLHPQLPAALALMQRGLKQDAIPFLRQLKHKSSRSPIASTTCPQVEPKILVALLLKEAGAKQEAQWLLRTSGARYLEQKPSSSQIAILQAAYPLAYRDELGAAEREHQLPELLLQALAREESGFNPRIVSWAGAYGLTQLLFGVAQSLGPRLEPPVQIKRSSQLQEPRLNARLGGALLKELLKRYKGHKGLSLAAYNGSVRRGNLWWEKHQHEGFDIFAEEMTVRETRHYVKRVLTTYGIYRWLYAQDAPKLQAQEDLPPKKK